MTTKFTLTIKVTNDAEIPAFQMEIDAENRAQAEKLAMAELTEAYPDDTFLIE